MQKVLSAEEMREVDRLTTEKYGIPSILLMENAAQSVARVITEKLGGSVKGKSFLILCGKGNNGGDGAALARILSEQSANVYVLLLGKFEDTKGDGRTNFKKLANQNQSGRLEFFQAETTEEIGKWWGKYAEKIEFDVIVDAVFGTGLNRPLGDLHEYFLDSARDYTIDKHASLIVAIDLPSGMDADSAEPIGYSLEADVTVTFTAPKLANVFPPVCRENGEVHIADIGSPKELIYNSPSKLFVAQKSDASTWLYHTRFTPDSYKNKRGHALLVVGSKDYTGAAVLAGNAAMISGVGLTTIATSESARTIIAVKVLEEIITRALPENKTGAIASEAFAEIEKLAEKVEVIGIGCGLGTTNDDQDVKFDGRTNLVRKVVENRTTPFVIDADALNALSPFDLQGTDDLPLIITPHEGEFLRLLGTKNKDVLKDRIRAVRDFAEKHKVFLVLKGERTLIGAPDGRVVINPTGNSGLGKAGNGDTLTGIITGFLAQTFALPRDGAFYIPPNVSSLNLEYTLLTVVAAVYLAGLAGDIAAEKYGRRSMLASDVRECLREAFQQIQS